MGERLGFGCALVLDYSRSARSTGRVLDEATSGVPLTVAMPQTDLTKLAFVQLRMPMYRHDGN